MELAVSVTVLAVGILATVQVFVSSLDVVRYAGSRSQAVALATREIEGLHAVPYDLVGFSTGQPGFLATFEARATVEVPAALVYPLSTVPMGNGRARVERHVTWDDATSPDGAVDYPRAYKRATVIVRWTENSTERSVRVDGIIYPGGRGRHIPPLVTTSTVPVPHETPPAPPFGLVATLRAGAEHSTVDLSWVDVPSVPEVSAWVVESSTDGFATATRITSTQPASVRAFAVTGLSPSTAYSFRVAGRSADNVLSPWSNVASATTAAASPSGCQVGGATITPNAALRRDNGTTLLAGDAAVSVNTSGTCAALRLSYRPTALGPTRSVFMLTTNGGVWTATVNGTNTPWDTGTHQIDVVDSSGRVVATLAFTVCSPNQKTCP